MWNMLSLPGNWLATTVSEDVTNRASPTALMIRTMKHSAINRASFATKSSALKQERVRSETDHQGHYH